jgi:hypothetical protein
MNKGLYALAGVIFALVAYSIIGPFFSRLGVGLVIGYSIGDKGEKLTAVWMKVHPHIDKVFAHLILLSGRKPEDDHERDNAQLSGKNPSSQWGTKLKDGQPGSRRKRTG